MDSFEDARVLHQLNLQVKPLRNSFVTDLSHPPHLDLSAGQSNTVIGCDRCFYENFAGNEVCSQILGRLLVSISARTCDIEMLALLASIVLNCVDCQDNIALRNKWEFERFTRGRVLILLRAQ